MHLIEVVRHPDGQEFAVEGRPAGARRGGGDAASLVLDAAWSVYARMRRKGGWRVTIRPWPTGREPKHHEDAADRAEAERRVEALVQEVQKGRWPYAPELPLGAPRQFCEDAIVGSKPTFLLRKGRVLEPRSKLRYRLLLLRSGHSMALAADELSVPLVIVRVLSLPFLTAFDFISWPVVARTVGRGSWWVVEVQFRDVEVDLVRVAEATDLRRARERLAELSAAAESRHRP